MQFTPYVLPLVASTAVLTILVLYAWRRRACIAAGPFALTMLALLLWTTGFVIEVCAKDLPAKVFWADVQFLGIAPLPVAWLAMVLTYTQRSRHPRWLIPALLVVPMATIAVIWTNRWHGLFRGQPSLDLNSASFAVLDNDYGPWFYGAHAPYGYLLFAASAVLLVRALLATTSPYRRQIVALLIATGIPLLIDVLYVLDISPIPHFNLTPVAFSLSGLLLGWSLLRYQFLDLIPVARTALVETIPDAWIVLDMAGRFADLNASARSLLAAPSGELIGRSAGELLPPPWQSLLKTDHDLHVEVELGLGAKERTFDLRLLLLQDGRGRRTGRLIVLHDVTARKVMERDQARLIDELQTALAEVRTLSGLLPICANCKKIRDDSGYWHSVEAYVVSHSQAEFTHSICPECAQELYPEYTNETG